MVLLCIKQIFDALSYSKAASGKSPRVVTEMSCLNVLPPVLRMLSIYVGVDKFLKGVSIYLKKHLFSNSVTKDLWQGIQEASGTLICFAHL